MGEIARFIVSSQVDAQKRTVHWAEYLSHLQALIFTGAALRSE
jgi:hypothetical protein